MTIAQKHLRKLTSLFQSALIKTFRNSFIRIFLSTSFMLCITTGVTAQPVSSAEIDNEYYFSEPESEMLEDPYEQPALPPSVYSASVDQSSGTFNNSSVMLWIGGLILGFIGLKFLKLVARFRVLILVLGLLTLLLFNVNAQPQPESSLNNDAYFGVATTDYGPIAMNAGPPPPPEIPIDGNILFLIGSGIFIGVYGIIRRSAQVNS